MTIYRQGNCLCGQVQVMLRAAPLAVAACHCRHCRKTSGSTFSLVALVRADSVEVSGPLVTFDDTADSGAMLSRRFCGACGAPVETSSRESDEQGIRLIKLGLFDELDDWRPTLELFCQSRVGWLPALDGTQTWPAMPAKEP